MSQIINHLAAENRAAAPGVPAGGDIGVPPGGEKRCRWDRRYDPFGMMIVVSGGAKAAKSRGEALPRHGPEGGPGELAGARGQDSGQRAAGDGLKIR